MIKQTSFLGARLRNVGMTVRNGLNNLWSIVANRLQKPLEAQVGQSVLFAQLKGTTTSIAAFIGDSGFPPLAEELARVGASKCGLSFFEFLPDFTTNKKVMEFALLSVCPAGEECDFTCRQVEIYSLQNSTGANFTLPQFTFDCISQLSGLYPNVDKCGNPTIVTAVLGGLFAFACLVVCCKVAWESRQRSNEEPIAIVQDPPADGNNYASLNA